MDSEISECESQLEAKERQEGGWIYGNRLGEKEINIGSEGVWPATSIPGVLMLVSCKVSSLCSSRWMGHGN